MKSTNENNLFLELYIACLEANVKREFLINPFYPGEPGLVIKDMAQCAEWDTDKKKWKFTVGDGHILYSADSVVAYLRDISPDHFNK